MFRHKLWGALVASRSLVVLPGHSGGKAARCLPRTLIVRTSHLNQATFPQTAVIVSEYPP